MSEVTFTSEISVELVRAHASDESVVWAARVSTLGDNADGLAADSARDAGLINYLMRERHGSPLEHNSFTFRTTAPIFVWREHMRHRMMSYNEESARYRKLEPVFYVPNRERNLVQSGKTGAYIYLPGSVEQHDVVESAIYATSMEAYTRYEEMLDAGVAREVARMVLPVNIFSTAYVTCNARSLMNFLSLRMKVEGAMFPSYPQREIEMVAEQYERFFAELMPLTYDAFVKNGRVSP
jgi:thymidylate synthase (FAD)